MTAQPHPFQELKAFAKTGELAPGQTEIIAMTIPWKELASFREDRAAWVIEAGTYLVKLGNSSAHTQTMAVVRVEKDILVQQVENRLVLDPVFREKLHLLVREPVLAKVPQGCPVLGLFPDPCGSGGGLLGPDGKSAGLPVRGLWLRSALPGLSGDRAALHPSRGWQASHR